MHRWPSGTAFRRIWSLRGGAGFWWFKWVERIEVDDAPPWWQPPFPLA